MLTQISTWMKEFSTQNTAIADDEIFYKDTAIGIAYAVNDELSISYNRYTSYPQTRVGAPEQETTAINLGYTMGGMTIGFQDASTDNSGYATGDNDTRTLGVSVAF